MISTPDGWAAHYARLMAKAEASRILSKWRYDPVSIFATSKIDPLPYQLEDFLRLVDMLEVGDARVLLAYETGLGKTILAGLFIREVLAREPDARALIVVPPPAIGQWIHEMRTKFGLRFDVYSRPDDLRRQLLIASMDTLKRRRDEVERRGSKWRVLVVDELHRATPGNMRYELIGLLSRRATHVLGLTATPHDGKQDHFIGRLQLVLPSVDESNYRRFLEEWSLRRRKRDVTDMEGMPLFPYSVHVNTVGITMTQEEEAFYRAVEDYVKEEYGRAEGNDSPRGLIVTVLGRMASSSVAAGIAGMKRRMDRIMSAIGVGEEVGEAYVKGLIERLREAEEDGED
ncbi:MAG: DEAD/DEAH box helicase family protein, partial [Conexivisphaera sp.]